MTGRTVTRVLTAVLLPLVVCLSGCHRRPAASPAIELLWKDQPAEALARKLEGTFGGTVVQGSVVLTQRVAFLPELQALRLETAVLAGDTGSVTAAGIPLLDLRFRLRKPGPPYEPLRHNEGTWYGSTYWTGASWTRVGRNWQHPGEATPSVRCFRVPAQGRVTLSGRIYKLDKAGDGVRVSIRLNEREIWKAEIDGADGQGVEPKVAAEVRPGDCLRFIVHKRGDIYHDTTFWDPVITFDSGSPHRASEGFSQARQGQGGWFYEMLTEELPAALQPVLLTIASDGLVQVETLAAARPVRRSSREALPLVALADGTNQSGIVVAVDSAGPWAFQTDVSQEGLLRLSWAVDRTNAAGQTWMDVPARLPTVWLAAYTGPWSASFAKLQRLVEAGDHEAGLRTFASATRAGLYRSGGHLQRQPEIDLLLLTQVEWLREDRLDGAATSYRAAATNHLARAKRLLGELRRHQPASFLRTQLEHAQELLERAGRPELTRAECRELYVRARLLKREIAFQNPLLDFKQLLFCKRRSPTHSQMVGQYFGWRQQPGGGLFILADPGYSARIRDLVGGQLPRGSFLEPRLSHDARRVVFSYVACPDQPLDCAALPVNEAGPELAYFHVHEMNLDGTGLRQLSRGTYDDLMPVYLPDGGIAFSSTRRRSYSRCFHVQFSHRWHSFTLFRMNNDGSGMQPLSFNDVNEWFPEVANDGQLLFARWDYIDRDAVTHQNLWSMRPDGGNPAAVWGNATPTPHCLFQAKAIPGSGKIVFVASAHHAVTGGPVCLLDPAVDRNSRMEAITRLTAGPFPEAESMQVPEYYESPWPLSESLFLVAYSPEPLQFENGNPNPDNALGLYLLDAAGNCELIYRDPHLSSTTPLPVKPRRRPAVVGAELAHPSTATGEMILHDVYAGLDDVPRGAIKALRVIQIFPKSTRDANTPRIGFAGEENARAILGTVPIESDGSARFLMPAHRPLLFQALDEHGFAYQTMRSTTSVQAGETTSCVGCHENRMRTAASRPALALRRSPSVIQRAEFEGEPFSFRRSVQPIFDRHCVRCHAGSQAPKQIDLSGAVRDGFTQSYWSLCGAPGLFDGDTTNPRAAAAALVPRFGQRNNVQVTPPGGMYGARGSRLIRMLRAGHQEVQLSDPELRRLAAWIDCNAIFYGTYDPQEQARQLAGKRIGMPAIQ